LFEIILFRHARHHRLHLPRLSQPLPCHYCYASHYFAMLRHTRAADDALYFHMRLLMIAITIIFAADAMPPFSTAAAAT